MQKNPESQQHHKITKAINKRDKESLSTKSQLIEEQKYTFFKDNPIFSKKNGKIILKEHKLLISSKEGIKINKVLILNHDDVRI